MAQRSNLRYAFYPALAISASDCCTKDSLSYRSWLSIDRLRLRYQRSTRSREKTGSCTEAVSFLAFTVYPLCYIHSRTYSALCVLDSDRLTGWNSDRIEDVSPIFLDTRTLPGYNGDAK
jgi:hypothetical protein